MRRLSSSSTDNKGRDMIIATDLKFKRVGSYDYEPPLPSYQTSGSVGMDIHAAELRIIKAAEGLFTIPHRGEAVGTGWAVEIPEGYELQIRARSGLAVKHGVTVLHGVGTIDSDYRGELKVILFNHGRYDVTVSPGDRIAQLILAPVTRARPVEVTALSDTERGEGGFGSTGQ